MGAVSSEPVSHVDKRIKDECENPGSVPEYPASESASRIPGSSRMIPDYPGLKLGSCLAERVLAGGPTARNPPSGARASRRRAGGSTRSRSPHPRTASARRVDRRATGATRPWHRQRATGSRHLAVRALARTPASSRRDTLSCISDAPSTSYVDRAPAAATGPADRRCPPK